MTHRDEETISSDERFDRLPFRRTDGAGRRRLQTTALATAASLVLAGGVATAAYRSLAGHPAPESLIPASAFAVAVADLSLPGGQDDALGAFADHFPGSPTHSGDGSAVDRLLRAAFKDSSDPHIDYDADVAPWLGDRVAIAGWLDGDQPRFEALLESTDDDAAREHLTEMMGEDPAPLTFHDGYVVLSDTVDHATAAVTAAAKVSLADSPDYASDLDRLPGDEAVTGWLDGPQLKKVLDQVMGPFGMSGLFGGLGAVGLPGGEDAFKGRLAVGVLVEDDYTQLDVFQVGGTNPGSGPSGRLTRLPGNTVAAVQIGNPGPVVDGITTVLRTVGNLAGTVQECTAFTGPPVYAVPPGTPNRRAVLRQLRELRRQAEQAQPTESCHTVTPPDPLTQFSAATGLRLPDDVRTLLGDNSVVSFGGLQIGALPDLALRSHPTDLDSARAAADRLRARLAEKFGITLAVEESEGDLVIATSSAYASAVVGNGNLGETDLAGTALGDVPAEVATGGFVDLSRIWPLAGGGVPEAVQHLKAIGFWSAPADGGLHTQLRLVVG